MSIQAVSWVLEESPAVLGGRLVLIAIANHTNRDTQDATLSYDAIGREARMSRRQVIDQVKRLEEAGDLEVDRPGGRRSNTYRIVGFGVVRNPHQSSGPIGEATGEAAGDAASPPTYSKEPGNREPSARGAPEGRRDLLFEALARFEGIDYEAGERPTDMEARRIATALARIRKAWPNVTPAELSGVVDAGLARGWSRPTALALANNLGALRSEARSRRGGLSDDTIREVMGR